MILASLSGVLTVYSLVGSSYALYLLQLSTVFVVTFAVSLFIAEVVCKWTGLC
ncbi:hypothetical protein IPA_03380 [Ignicoccus pacificus DSM 13166]|uniref:Uncharacterized protein n=1 Tax=Ignicoccus pacificus DSM 13166 TaxID=940294 RepID=A0A977PKR8_9CREN|nr:hypothetical protein IPA_03380 [Ignicoccus pacificus DSM 13166]